MVQESQLCESRSTPRRCLALSPSYSHFPKASLALIELLAALSAAAAAAVSSFLIASVRPLRPSAVQVRSARLEFQTVPPVRVRCIPAAVRYV